MLAHRPPWVSVLPTTKPPPWKNTTTGPGARVGRGSNSVSARSHAGPGIAISLTTARSPTGRSGDAMVPGGIWRICAMSASVNGGRGAAFIASRNARTSGRMKGSRAMTPLPVLRPQLGRQQVEPGLEPALDRRARRDAAVPAAQRGEFVEPAAVLRILVDPRPSRDVGDRVRAAQVLVAGKASLEHAEQPLGLALEAVQREIGFGRIAIGLGRGAGEVVDLPRHRPQPRHLPEQPAVDARAYALVGRIELAGLAPEVLQDRGGFEDRKSTR